MSARPAGLAAGTSGVEVFHQLGLITRQLHDALNQLGVMSTLQNSAETLSDARSRLNFIARKTGEAADKVLTAVELAKKEQARCGAAAQRLSTALAGADDQAAATQAALAFAADVGDAGQNIDTHLTNIMLAQDFHDITGQVVARVVALATDLEGSLVKLLVQAAPGEPSAMFTRQEPATLNGPVIDMATRCDVVANQGEVDDLLASLGF